MPNTTMLRSLSRPFTGLTLSLLLALGGISLAYAQGATGKIGDAQQATEIEADQLVYDDAKQVGTFTGNVVLTRGSLNLRAHKMVVFQDEDSYQFVTLYGASGKPATFRERRGSSPNLWVEGEARDRIEYDGKTEIVQLFGNGRVTLLDGTRITDKVEGDYISYDSRAEFYTVKNTGKKESRSNDGRIRVTIQPRNEDRGQ
jgi:lipopolysaccharide export system protein LptA